MIYSDEDFNKLISNLESAKIVSLVEKEEEIFDDEEDLIDRKINDQPDVQFAIKSSSHNNLYHNFKKEVQSNKLAIGFNKQFYCDNAINQCKLLKSKIERIQIMGINLCVRNDAVYKQFKIGEVEEGVDDEGNYFSVPKSQIIDPMAFEEFGRGVLIKISKYFTYQEKVLNSIIDYLSAEIKMNKISKPRNSSYEYKYFKFNHDELGEYAKENINDFVDALININFISSKSKKPFVDFFDDRQSTSKVVWKTFKNKLWYLISQMEVRKYIYHTYGMKSEIITRVFVNEDGQVYKKRDFKGVNDPVDTKEVDKLLANLRQ